MATDVELLQQVLGNLIDNACKYSRGADDRRIWLRVRLASDRLLLEVEDRGPGVPAGERRTILRPFRRGRVADETVGGVGLGLARPALDPNARRPAHGTGRSGAGRGVLSRGIARAFIAD